ncbi:class I SAM-dependent methyltransferase [Elioraea tepida]|jgi:demethylmenaquinone methyltransferase/2-methoxy-6-polyprenyl-1,4-benzoquinol methylase|uniref:Ubiquinone/menaquinone biosynthesis C-methyltransferase UbiE n=1 Tax=Elioraea tepida TaxID=2843330 RepID=A0A975U1P9_9PROT|nr:class I SAM-dependent methyltransferase [Elioraea tepida]QXM23748.1 class I SAM-dependent methyltransferase [Elioraea tepida]
MTDNAAPGEETTHFGFRTVPREAKKALVRGVFDGVARRYDLMNDLMSLGVHRLWKRAFLAQLAPRPSMRLLDLAGGTGDIAFGALERGAGFVVLSDINAAMLAVAQDRAMERGLAGRIALLCADAEQLPIPDRAVTAVTIAFGLRNCTDIAAVLAEARRVLEPGGRFLCLEFSRVTVAPLAPLYDAYSFRVLPALGRLVARDEEAYRYLAESIRRFPPQEELAALMRRAGFARVAWRDLSGGIAAIHSGWRL